MEAALPGDSQVCLRREVTTSRRWKSPRFSSSTFYTSAISWELGHLQFTLSEEGTHMVVRIYLYYNYPNKSVFATLEITYISYKCVNRYSPQPKNISTGPTTLFMIHHVYSGLQICHSSALIFIRLLSGLASLASAGHLSELKFWTPPGLTESESLEVEPSNLHFNKLSKCDLHTLKLENH